MSDERTAKKIYDRNVSGKRSSGIPRLIFENTVTKIQVEGHVKSMRILLLRRRTVDEAKEVCRDRSVWRSVLSDYPARVCLGKLV